MSSFFYARRFVSATVVALALAVSACGGEQSPGCGECASDSASSALLPQCEAEGTCPPDDGGGEDTGPCPQGTAPIYLNYANGFAYPITVTANVYESGVFLYSETQTIPAMTGFGHAGAACLAAGATATVQYVGPTTYTFTSSVSQYGVLCNARWVTCTPTYCPGPGECEPATYPYY